MPTDIDSGDVDISAHRAIYDPGPSGTAVAGLIIGLIALAVSLYAAFAPRETVQQGSEAVQASWQETVEASRAERPAQAPRQPEPSSKTGQTDASWTEQASEEMSRQLNELRQELSELRDRVDKSDQKKPSPAGDR